MDGDQLVFKGVDLVTERFYLILLDGGFREKGVALLFKQCDFRLQGNKAFITYIKDFPKFNPKHFAQLHKRADLRRIFFGVVRANDS